jgi:hypothetical protein
MKGEGGIKLEPYYLNECSWDWIARQGNAWHFSDLKFSTLGTS